MFEFNQELTITDASLHSIILLLITMSGIWVISTKNSNARHSDQQKNNAM